MSKLFNIISKGQGRAGIPENAGNSATPNIQLEMPLGLPAMPSDNPSVYQPKRRAPRRDGSPDAVKAEATIASLRDQVDSLRKKLEQSEESVLLKKMDSVTRESEAVKQLLERTQKELEDAREWQADPAAPKYKERETELLRIVEKLQAESESTAAVLDKTRRELSNLRTEYAGLKREHTALQVEHAAIMEQLSANAAGMEQKETQSTPEPREETPEKHFQIPHASSGTGMETAACGDLLRGKPRGDWIKPVAACFIVIAFLAMIGFFMYYGLFSRPTDDSNSVLAMDSQLDSESTLPDVEDSGPVDLIANQPSLEAVDNQSVEQYEFADPSSVASQESGLDDGLWPIFDLQGVEVEKTPHACFLEFRQALFNEGDSFSEYGREAMSDLALALSPYSDKFCVIVVGYSGADSESAASRVAAVKEVLVMQAGFPADAVIARLSALPAENTVKGVNMRLIYKDRIVRARQ